MKRFCACLLAFFLCGLPALADEVNGWDISWEKPEITHLLEVEEQVETYTGDMMMHRIQKQAPAGYVFYMLPITVSRKQSDAELFHAEKIKLHLGNQTFTRMEDDGFLIDYGKTPFTHLKIKLGTHTGLLIFVVPESLKTNSFTLTYQNQLIQGD